MTQEEIKKNFSQNLCKLRKDNNLTQLQLAEKVNYSDKSVSKWEVGSVIPDVETLTQIAEFFGVTVNNLIYPPKKKLSSIFTKNHLLTTLIAVAVVWFIASIIYFVLEEATSVVRAWLTFIIAMPISFVVLIVFTSMWFKKIWVMISISGLFWSILTTIYLTINDFSLWFIFIIGVVGQLLIVLSGQIKKYIKIIK